MTDLDFDDVKRFARVLEALLLAAAKPLSLERILELFDGGTQPSHKQIKAGLEQLSVDIKGRSYQLSEVASGFRYQVRQEVHPWISRMWTELWEERPQRYSRAMLETLALIVYRQPITRGEIEDVRGVAVSTQIIKTLLEREWIRVVGYKDVPGKPAMLATTKTFLDYFNLQGLEQLPNLSELQQLQPAMDELTAPVEEVTAVVAQASAGNALEQTVDNTSRVSFGTLLEELESMEHGLVTEFSDPAIDNDDKSSDALTGQVRDDTDNSRN